MRRIFGHYISSAVVWLNLVESAALTIILCAGLYRLSAVGIYPIASTMLLLSLVAIVAIIMHASGLYDDLHISLLRVVLVCAPLFFLAALAICQLAGQLACDWAWIVGLAGTLLLAIVAIRAVFRKLHADGVFTTWIVLFGDDAMRERIREVILVEAQGDFAVVGEFSTDRTSIGRDERLETELIERAHAERASELIVDADSTGQHWFESLRRKMLGVRVVTFAEFYERAATRLDLDTLSPRAFPAVARSRPHMFSGVKRLLDVTASLIGLVLAAPVMLLAAVAIPLDSIGPVLYRQERVGLNGTTFWILKFRSMRTDAESDGEPRWASDRDPRVTRVGRILRLFYIDELPQFFNILRGDMSLIGPRPERPYFVELLSAQIPFFERRCVVRPGITGWAQVSYHYGASVSDARRKLSYDLYYVKNQSLFLDLVIAIRTVRVILGPLTGR